MPYSYKVDLWPVLSWLRASLLSQCSRDSTSTEEESIGTIEGTLPQQPLGAFLQMSTKH